MNNEITDDVLRSTLAYKQSLEGEIERLEKLKAISNDPNARDSYQTKIDELTDVLKKLEEEKTMGL